MMELRSQVAVRRGSMFAFTVSSDCQFELDHGI